jgi:DNA-binding CsgD family transcriptional regulator
MPPWWHDRDMSGGAGAHGAHGALMRLAHRGLDLRGFGRGAGRVLGRSVPFDGLCLLTFDPATLLPVGEVVEHGLPPDATARMAEIELAGGDVNGFSALTRSPTRTGALSAATRGCLDASRRHRELRGPHGFGDELRTVLVDGGSPWGALTLLRRADRPDFTPAEVAAVARVTEPLAAGLRRAMLLGSPTALDDDRGVGVLALAADNTVLSADATAQGWCAELSPADSGAGVLLPPVIGAVAARARRLVDQADGAEAPASARVRTGDGRWLLVRGSALAHTTVIVIEPAGPHELAPLIAAAYGLTPRERRLTQLVARGHPTAEIAALMHLSPWTVQDHLKSVFEKVGVGSRGALVARLFFEHYAPRLGGHDRP